MWTETHFVKIIQTVWLSVSLFGKSFPHLYNINVCVLLKSLYLSQGIQPRLEVISLTTPQTPSHSLTCANYCHDTPSDCFKHLQDKLGASVPRGVDKTNWSKNWIKRWLFATLELNTIFASLVHSEAVRLIKLAPDLWVDGLWQPVWSMKDLQDEVMWFIVPFEIKSVFNLSLHIFLSSFFNPSCDITALTSDGEGVGEDDGVGGADSAGVVSSVRSSHKPQDQSVSLTGLLKRDPKNINLFLNLLALLERKTDQLLHNMLLYF